MYPPKTNILILDDEPDIRGEINEFLTSRDIHVLEAALPSEAFQVLSGHPIDIAILDIRLPEMNGLDVLKEMRRRYPKIQVIMISGHADMDSVIQALRMGAVDFFQKPFVLHEMMSAIEKARKCTSFVKPLNGDHFDYMLNEIFGRKSLPALIVVSPLMRQVVEKMRLVAHSNDTTVLITGESGTGKELIARGIHYLSCRKEKPFHAVNCSSIPDELFESEFFGYKKGAFTGAMSDKAGWFEAADGGTLFLDEIGDLKPSLQAKLLRVMDDRQICRLGSVTSRKIDVRIIAATNQDLEKFILENRFRQDLYHRINIFDIHIPPLRERTEVIPLLVAHYLEYYSKKMDRNIPKLDHRIMAAFQQYDFPGNVRELKHMIERAVILCEGNELTEEHFDHLEIKLNKALPAKEMAKQPKSLVNTEREVIEATLQENSHNKSKSARLLNISRQALDRRIKKLGIEVK